MLRQFFLVLLLAPTLVHSDPLSLHGTIGSYEIEMELVRDAESALSGRYRYAGKEAWLTLDGQAYGQDVVALTEQFEGQETGAFFLDVVSKELVGVWVTEERDLPVKLTATSGDLLDVLEPVSRPEVNSAITGQYTTGGHWVNTMWAPQYEVGFNGGTVNVAKIDAEGLLIHFDFIVGPTYHIASFRGVAQRTAAGVFEHKAVLEGSSEACHLTFRFSQSGLSVSDNNSGWTCQFGARAHANFDLEKTSDIAEFEEFR